MQKYKWLYTKIMKIKILRELVQHFIFNFDYCFFCVYGLKMYKSDFSLRWCKNCLIFNRKKLHRKMNRNERNKTVVYHKLIKIALHTSFLFTLHLRVSSQIPITIIPWSRPSAFKNFLFLWLIINFKVAQSMSAPSSELWTSKHFSSSSSRYIDTSNSLKWT